MAPVRTNPTKIPGPWVEGYVLDLERCIAGGRGGPGCAVGKLAGIGLRIEAGQQHHVIDAGQLGQQFVDQLATVVRLAAILVAGVVINWTLDTAIGLIWVANHPG